MAYRSMTDEMMDAIALDESRWFNSTKPLNSDQAWRNCSFGSAACASGSYAHALEAYAEYKNYDW